MTRVLTSILFAVLALSFLAAGASVLLVNTGLLPDSLREGIIRFSRGDLGVLHLLQELGCLLVFVGLIAAWFVWHYEQSRGFHWAMTFFWGLMAIIHWFHVAGPPSSVVGPLVNTIPVILFTAVGVLRLATESSRAKLPLLPSPTASI